MAWIELDLSVLQSAELLTICDNIDGEPHEVLGCLAIIWGYVDEHGRLDGDDAVIAQMTLSRLQRAVPPTVARVAAQLAEVNWLEECNNELLRFPNFKRHAPKGCKRDRKAWGKQMRRKQENSDGASRGTSRPANSGTSRGTARATPTDLYTPTDLIDPTAAQSPVNKETPNANSSLTAVAVCGYWNEAMNQRCRVTPKRAAQFKSRIRDEHWRDNWREAIHRVASRPSKANGNGGIDWVMDFEFFLRPDTVTNIMEGKYDIRSATSSPGRQNREEQREDGNRRALQDFLTDDQGGVCEVDGDADSIEADFRVVSGSAQGVVCGAGGVRPADAESSDSDDLPF